MIRMGGNMNWRVENKPKFVLELTREEFEAVKQAVLYAVHRVQKHAKSGMHMAPCNKAVLGHLKNELLELSEEL